MFYLRNRAKSQPCPVSIIPKVHICKFDPWELPEKAEFGENEWHPNGVRPNRATVSGYWKATGTDKAIHGGSKYMGVEKAQVFYKGRPPKGIKTDWIMHEYRLSDTKPRPNNQIGSMRLDDWVLSRIYKKKHIVREMEHKIEDSSSNRLAIKTADHDHSPIDQGRQMLKFPRTFSLAHLLDMELN